MLGRYVFGTVVILGIAMLMVPPASERNPQVAASVVDNSDTSDATAEAVASVVAALASESSPVSAPVESTPLPVRTAEEIEEIKGPEPLSDEPVQVSMSTNSFDTATVLETDADALPVWSAASLSTLPDPFQDADSSVQEASLETPAVAAPAEPDTATLFVSGSRVNVRSGPSTSYGVVTSVKYGDAVQLVAFEGNGWAHVRVPGLEESVYMSRKFLTRENPGG